MNDLLHPCRSTFRRRDDKDIRRIRLIVETPLPPFWRRKILHPFVHFFYGCGTGIVFPLAHLLSPPSSCMIATPSDTVPPTNARVRRASLIISEMLRHRAAKVPCPTPTPTRSRPRPPRDPP